MPILKAKDLRSKFLGSKKSILEQRNFSRTTEYKLEEIRASKLLKEVSDRFNANKQYHIFLSHSYKDAIDVYQIYLELTSAGKEVYVDWIDDPHLDRDSVSPATAATLRRKMANCQTLILAFSENSKISDWVQWELGLADGQKKGRVAIMPIREDGLEANFHRQEYLGLYPFISRVGANFWVNGNGGRTKTFSAWTQDSNPYYLIHG